MWVLGVRPAADRRKARWRWIGSVLRATEASVWLLCQEAQREEKQKQESLAMALAPGQHPLEPQLVLL